MADCKYTIQADEGTIDRIERERTGATERVDISCEWDVNCWEWAKIIASQATRGNRLFLDDRTGKNKYGQIPEEWN